MNEPTELQTILLLAKTGKNISDMIAAVIKNDYRDPIGMNVRENPAVMILFESLPHIKAHLIEVGELLAAKKKEQP